MGLKVCSALRTLGGQVTGALPQLLVPLAHLDQALSEIRSDLLKHLSASYHLHGDHGLQVGAVGRRCLMGGRPLRRGAPLQRLTKGPVHNHQTTSEWTLQY